MKKILVACGTGMSTSTMIAHKLQEFLTEQGISATTAQCCLNEIPLNCNGMDLIVPPCEPTVITASLRLMAPPCSQGSTTTR